MKNIKPLGLINEIASFSRALVFFSSSLFPNVMQIKIWPRTPVNIQGTGNDLI